MMDKPMSNWHFRFMSLGYKFRDFFLPRRTVLQEVGLEPGFHVLDYGCGTGSYIAPTVELVGETGKVYALDIHPMAIRRVQKLVSKRRLGNVETISSDCNTGLPDGSVDVALLYDIFHELGEPDAVLEELYRVLKPDGILSFSDHHLKEIDLVSKVTASGLFGLMRKGKKTYTFSKPGPDEPE